MSDKENPQLPLVECKECGACANLQANLKMITVMFFGLLVLHGVSHVLYIDHKWGQLRADINRHEQAMRDLWVERDKDAVWSTNTLNRQQTQLERVVDNQAVMSKALVSMRGNVDKLCGWYASSADMRPDWDHAVKSKDHKLSAASGNRIFAMRDGEVWAVPMKANGCK